ncbi:hypothetical protein K439DRAFT_1618518 [Ramaria rubella]|nr:hypothetical protein K439DRAFT_1618518 [Ramaria rubella]
MNAPAKRGRWELCDGAIEITADNLTRATIWQFGQHPNVKPEHGLHWSQRLRNLVSERLRLGGAKVSTIQKELISQYNFPTQTSRPTNAPDHIPLQLPEFRRPTAKQLRSMFPAVRRRKRLHKDPFEAVHLLQERNPDKIYNSYTAHDHAKLDSESEFTCVITDKHALKRLILHGTWDGIGCDTSWHNKNENRAVATFLTVVDGNDHLTPGSALLSANIRMETLAQYLTETKEKVIERVHQIVENDIAHTLQEDHKEIVRLAKVILKDGWNIPKWMIDKCRAELKAIKKEWPVFQEQFLAAAKKTIMEQCVDEDTDESSADGLDLAGESGSDTPTSIPMRATCIGKGTNSSEHAVKLLQWDFVKNYFPQNWFTEEWLECITDIGLPPGQTQDGTWNTNNPSESVFQVFDSVFLDNRCKKRWVKVASH